LRPWLRFFVRMMRGGLRGLFFAQMVGFITDAFACKQRLRVRARAGICVAPWRYRAGHSLLLAVCDSCK
jgi:hypothetical protein